MRIMVAGGSGFIGSHLCRALLGRGHRVVCVDDLSTGSAANVADLMADPRFELIQTDVARAPSIPVDLTLARSLYRTRGRIAGGLTPFRRRGVSGFTLPRTVRLEEWSEEWNSMEARLRGVEEHIQESGAAVRRGGDEDSWDLEVRTGSFASAGLIGTLEEHGHGQQLVRWRIWPRASVVLVCAALAFLGLAIWTLDGGALLAAAAALTLTVFLFGRTVLDAGEALRVGVRFEPRS